MTDVEHDHDEQAFQNGAEAEQEAASPLTFERVYDRELADFEIDRLPRGDSDEALRTDADIVDIVRQRKEQQYWFMNEHYLKKGAPAEQLELEIGDAAILISNYDREHPLDDERTAELSGAIFEITRRFPEILEHVDYITITDVQFPSAYNDDERYPLNGYISKAGRSVLLTPRAMEPIPHRVVATTNLRGTIVHELTHFIDKNFFEVWKEIDPYPFCDEDPDAWEHIPASDGKSPFFRNRITGEVTPTGLYAARPERCVTDYARISYHDDICDSAVAYVYDPELLKKKAEEKYAALEAQDVGSESLEMVVRRISDDEVALPTIPPQIVRYFVTEPGEANDFEITLR